MLFADFGEHRVPSERLELELVRTCMSCLFVVGQQDGSRLSKIDSADVMSDFDQRNFGVAGAIIDLKAAGHQVLRGKISHPDAWDIAEKMADFASLLLVLLCSGDADKSPVLHRPLYALFWPPAWFENRLR